jgi:Arc/MetJ-type ribon-helix-helix transcriptional regulator
MATTTKVTITLLDSQLAQIRKRVATRKSASISGFIQHAVKKSLENEAAFGAMLDEMLEETGGPLTPKERAWAKRMLAPRKRRSKRRKVA